MTLLYVEGFEGFDSAGNRTALDVNYDFIDGMSTGEAGLFTPGRLAGRAAFTDDTGVGVGAAQGGMLIPLAGLSTDDTWIVGYAFRVPHNEFNNVGSDRPPVIQFRNSEGVAMLSIYPRAGTLTARLGATGGTLLGVAAVSIVANVWYFLESKVTFHGSTGTLELRIHEQSVLSLSGINTTNTGDLFPTQLLMMGSMRNVHRCEGDDLYICDGVDATATQGVPYNDYLGDNIVLRLTPNSSGPTNDFDGSDGNSVDNHLLVDDDPPDGDDEYVESQTIGEKDLYGFENMTVTPAQIEAVVLKSYARKTDGGTRTFVHVARSGTTEGDSAAIAPSTDYQFHQSIFTEDPDTGARWLKAGVDAMAGGVKVAS